MRQNSGTARVHLAAKAVDLTLEAVMSWTKRECVTYLAVARWGSADVMPCPHCGTTTKHYFRPLELRWKCKGCDSTFSVTSGTVYADRKMPLQRFIATLLGWANGSAGKPALQLRRDTKSSYNATFSLLHKAREGLARMNNVGVLCGVQEGDGMDALGKDYKGKRNQPQVRSQPKPQIPAHLLKPADGEPVGPPAPFKAQKRARMPEGRRLCLTFRQRGVVKGKGAVRTRVVTALQESAMTVSKFARQFLSTSSHLVTDEDPSYAKLGKSFASHHTIKHSEAFSKDGINQNQAESFNARLRRSLEGTYLNVSRKYLHEYACEAAWREDTRRLSTGERLQMLLNHALNAGLSHWWRGFTHGKHRKYEALVEGPQDVRSSGPRKGRHPLAPAAWATPR